MVKKKIFLSVTTKTDEYDHQMQKSSPEATDLTAPPTYPSKVFPLR